MRTLAREGFCVPSRIRRPKKSGNAFLVKFLKESGPKGKMTLAVSSAEGGRGVRPSGVEAAENDTSTESSQLSVELSSRGDPCGWGEIECHRMTP